MTARWPNAFALSATLHGAVAALVLLSFWFARNRVRETPHIFELVAGPGDNYTANAAPALGNPAGEKFNPPRAPRPIVSKPVVTPAPTPEATPSPAKPVPQQRLTQAEFEKQNATKPAATKPASVTPPKVTHVDGQGIAGGVVGGSPANTRGGAGGRALTQEQTNEIQAYYSLFRSHVRDAHQKPEGLSDLLQALVAYRQNADGSVTNVQIIQSSGNPDFDRSVREAFRRMAPMPPPPTGFQPGTFTLLVKLHDDN